MKNKSKVLQEIQDYDHYETTDFIDKTKPLTLKDLGIKLPKEAPTTVVSIRLPTWMLNAIRAYSSQQDIPYQSVIKLFLQEEIKRHHLEEN